MRKKVPKLILKINCKYHFFNCGHILITDMDVIFRDLSMATQKETLFFYQNLFENSCVVLYMYVNFVVDTEIERASQSMFRHSTSAYNGLEKGYDGMINENIDTSLITISMKCIVWTLRFYINFDAVLLCIFFFFFFWSHRAIMKTAGYYHLVCLIFSSPFSLHSQLKAAVCVKSDTFLS